LGQVDVACRGVKAAALGHRDESAQVAEIEIHVHHALIAQNFAIHIVSLLMHDRSTST